MKFIIVAIMGTLGFACVSFGAVTPPVLSGKSDAMSAKHYTSTNRQSTFDVNAALAGGATSGASGDNAVAAAADEDSGAVGVVGEDTAIGAAAPGAAIGLGFENFFGTSAATDPAATPSAANIFNFFNQVSS